MSWTFRASRGVGALGTSRSVGTLGGQQGCRQYWGWHVDWESNHIGPQSRVPAFPLVGV